MRKWFSRYDNTVFIVTMVSAFAAAGVIVLQQRGVSMSGWQTDFNIRDVPLGDFTTLGERDEVSPIDHPRFVTTDDAATWLGDKSPVIALEINDDMRAYPLAVLVFHQVVNDEMQGIPVAVTYCPLCNSAIVYNRQVGENILRFGVSGAVRNSGFIMWDNLTESWWQQFTGKAIMGSYTGTMLDMLPSKVVSFGAFKSCCPQGQVLAGDEYAPASMYVMSPMEGYDSQTEPAYYEGQVDERLPALERVLSAVINGQPVAYPFTLLARMHIINDTVNDMAVVAFWQPGAVSPLDNIRIDRSRDVGMAVLFYRDVNGQTLTFYDDNGVIKDSETGSTWSIFGKATDGALKGTKLTQAGGSPNFWFAWSAAYPETLVYPP